MLMSGLKNYCIRYVAVIVIASFNENVSSRQLVTVLHYTMVCPQVKKNSLGQEANQSNLEPRIT